MDHEGVSRPPAPRTPVPARAADVVREPDVEAAPPGLGHRVGRVRDVVTASVAGHGGAPRWFSGVFAGVQAAVLSLVVVAVPALAAYVATSADPTNAGVEWPRAVAVGAGIWALAHGGALTAGGATITLVPLGITVLALFSAHASARRSALPGLGSWLAGILAYAAVTAVVVVLAGSAGPVGAGPGPLLRLALGTVLVAGTGLGTGMVRARRLRELTRPWWSRVPPLVRSGAVAGVLVVALLAGAASLLAGAWVVSGRAAQGDVVAGLGVDLFGGTLLAVAQVAVAPNFVLWALAWLVGPGFVIGEGTLYSPAEIVSGPLPALPLLGALPTDAGGLLRWVPLVVLVAGCLAGWWLHRRLAATRAWEPFAASACAAVTAGVLVAVGTMAAGGSVGPGRLAVVGGSAVLVGGSVLLGTLAGAVLTSVPTDPVVRRAVTQRLRRGGAPSSEPTPQAQPAPAEQADA